MSRKSGSSRPIARMVPRAAPVAVAVASLVMTFAAGPASAGTKGPDSVEDAVEASDAFGTAMATGDFNRDGREDLATGVPLEDVGTRADAGAVNVIYGSSPSGLSSTVVPDQFLHQDSASMEDVAEAGDRFGAALASADFNYDGYDDLAIGIPYEDIGTVRDAGAVSVVYGSPNGLNSASGGEDDFWHQNVASVEDVAEAGDRYGHSLAAGWYDGTLMADLAIGVVGESVGAVASAGAVNVLYGSNYGLVVSGDQLWHQNVTYIEDVAETSDQFGFGLTSGDFNGNGVDDLAIGVPYEDIGSIVDAGAVSVLYGNSSVGLAPGVDQFWHQDSTGIEDGSETSDRFGSAITAGDFDGNASDDLAVGVPMENLSSIADAGLVSVIYGSTTSGLSATAVRPDQLWHQDSTNVPDAAETGDRFGTALAAADFNGASAPDAPDDLVIGVPFEDLGALSDAGGMMPIYGHQSLGLTMYGGQAIIFWHQDYPEVEDAAETGDQFAFSSGLCG